MKPDTQAKVTYGFWGLIGGAGLAMIIGFNWGGWSTSSTTEKMSEEAVLASHAAICVAQFMKDPNHETKLKEFEGTDNYNRSEFIEKGGWDKMPGQEKAAWGVSSPCVAGIEVLLKG
ncbi:MAG: hypothetical protein OEN48_03315 [Betaproteobacteria bacterium]|nr:hypothetical protein [Gammaproteobacteria bacterium]MDH3436002.1 hypothetical protein [Betaproteobacteria bacterium]